MAKCPKCGAEGLRESINRRSKQRIGHCPSCGRLVTLGRTENIEPDAGKEKKDPPKKEEAAQPKKTPRGKAAPASNRTGGAKRGRPRNDSNSKRAGSANSDDKGKSAGSPVQSQPKAGWGKRISDFFNREL